MRSAGSTPAGDFERVLSADELRRAHAFRNEDDARAFAVTRGALRVLLARYLRSAPAALRFVEGPYGKPALPDASVHFNASHSGGLALLALSPDRELGVDIEAIRALDAPQRVAGEFMCARELAQWNALPPRARDVAFFRTWTQKEAVIKALGVSTAAASEVCVDVRATGEPRLLSVGDDAGEAAALSVHDIAAAPGYAAALAYRGARCELRIASLADAATLFAQ